MRRARSKKSKMIGGRDLKSTKVKKAKTPVSKDGFLDATCELSGLGRNRKKRYDCLDGGGTF